jgi:hypothetical protein
VDDGRAHIVVAAGSAMGVLMLKDGFAEPAGVTLVGNTAYVSEAQLSFLLNPQKKNLTPSLPFHITAVPLTGR